MGASLDRILAERLLLTPAEVRRTLPHADPRKLAAYELGCNAIARAATAVIEAKLRQDHVQRLRRSATLTELELLAADLLDELRATVRRGELAPFWWQ